jgi:hypothetical protein
MENRIREFKPSIDRSELRRAAKLAKRREDAYDRELTEEQLLLCFSTITYADPTGDEASKKADRDAAARRVAGSHQ